MGVMMGKLLWTHDAPCGACGWGARFHDLDGYGPEAFGGFACGDYLPIACQGPDDNHGGPVRVRADDAELCTLHEEARK